MGQSAERSISSNGSGGEDDAADDDDSSDFSLEDYGADQASPQHNGSSKQ